MGSFFDLMYMPSCEWRKGELYEPFTRVSLETCSTCTRSCSFCPVNQRPHALKVMDDRLYHKIIAELGELNFNGVVQWFYVNEPLMDKNHIYRIQELRNNCPKCTIHLTTNWETQRKRTYEQQVQKINDLFDAGVNSLNINCYDLEYLYDYQLLHVSNVNADRVDEHCWKRLSPRKRVFSVSDMTSPDPASLHTWTGAISSDKAKQTGKGRCARPHRHLVIDWEGNVPLCCATNPTGMEVISNVREHSLIEAWNAPRFFHYRYQLQQGIRDEQCKDCNEKMAYPHVVRDVSR